MREDALVAEKPAKQPGPAFADPTGYTQDRRRAREPSGESASNHTRLVERRFDLMQRMRADPGVGVQKQKNFAPGLLSAQIHLKRALAPGTVNDARSTGF